MKSDDASGHTSSHTYNTPCSDTSSSPPKECVKGCTMKHDSVIVQRQSHCAASKPLGMRGVPCTGKNKESHQFVVQLVNSEFRHPFPLPPPRLPKKVTGLFLVQEFAKNVTDREDLDYGGRGREDRKKSPVFCFFWT